LLVFEIYLRHIKRSYKAFWANSRTWKKLEWVNAEGKYKWTAAKSLFSRIKNMPAIKSDPEGEPTLKLFDFYKTGFEKASMEQQNIEQIIKWLKEKIETIATGIATMESEKSSTQNENLKISQEELWKLSNEKFLETPANERLRYISKGNIESADIASGKVKEVSFTFTFDGKFNQDMYMYTTAGQVLPNEVRSIVSDGKHMNEWE